ncbi:MAG: UDP-N-acetylmuramyl-tripeptide synthetase [Enterovirga sp.]|nr:UDP-N-acetylmuramyl-tripeptide synthetase [Enterovirga sp.]
MDARLAAMPCGPAGGGSLGAPAGLKGAMPSGRPTSLADLFPDAAGASAPVPVVGIAEDSRRVREGFVFVAVPGTKADGAGFIGDAVARGAVAVVGEAERPASLPPEIHYLRVGDARRALALAAARLHPGQPETIVAVTGTSGKSSVADFTRQLFATLGQESASLGTLGIVSSRGASYGSLTTPDPISLHRQLEELAGQGVTHLALEASSHGLAQRRLEGVRLSAAAFTNLGRDHLDYHPDLEDYLQAKLRLFRELLPADAPAVINADGAEAARAVAAAGESGRTVLTVGRAGSTLKLLELVRTGFAQRLTVRTAPAQGRGAVDVVVDLPLVGGFQVENALVAAGLVLATQPGLAPEVVLRALSGLRGVPGRLERVGEHRGALAVVDYAHKPDALREVLATLRPFASGRLVCVFGCGGDRDRG